MAATIGINSMILFAACFEFIGGRAFREKVRKQRLNRLFWTAQAALMVFWLALNVAGIKKGLWQMSDPQIPFSQMMAGLRVWFAVFAGAGLVLAGALALLSLTLLKAFITTRPVRKQRRPIILQHENRQLQTFLGGTLQNENGGAAQNVDQAAAPQSHSRSGIQHFFAAFGRRLHRPADRQRHQRHERPAMGGTDARR
jgi:hypothetical protein